ncbi:hypothetical protein [Microbispora sp. H13382]|uniref:hypothetical protein n=1 Tax=Microbispora sp. H13382 TaxID=2729112 RepID=UPI001603AA2A|nr:hypothetical protein [Microbispora sp. H13382]
MILISAALVLAAIVLLIAGVVLGTPPLVMWSIVVSVLSAVCLLIGALLRRHELFPAGGRAAEGTAPTPPGSSVPQLAHVGAVSGAYGGALAGAPAHPVATPMVAAPPVTHHGALPPQTFPSPPPQRTGPITRPPAASGRGLAPDAIVLVIPGRKRFHLATCRQLAGRETEELTHEEAREEGFTPCTTCLPEASARVAEPEEAAPRDGSIRDDSIRDESLRAEAAPTTTTPAAGTTGTTGREPTRLTPADPEPPFARLPQPGVPGSRLPEPPVPPARSEDAPSGDETREESPETPRMTSGETAGEADAPGGPKADTAAAADAGAENDEHTPVDWFGRGGAQPSDADAPAPGTAATSWSAPAWSPPAAGSVSGPADDETDESITDTAEHDWFSPGRVSRPWDPARSKTAEAAKDAPSSGDGDPAGDTAAEKTSEEAPASPQAAPSSRADDERARDNQTPRNQGDPGADANAASLPADAPTSPPAGTGEPVEPAETRESGRAGFAASAGSTSGSAPVTGTSGEDRAAGAAEPSEDGDTQVRVMVGTRRYHIPGCPLIAGTDDTGIEIMTLTEAGEAGLTPCSVCRKS